MIITKDTTAEEFQQAHTDAVHTVERREDRRTRHYVFLRIWQEARLAGRPNDPEVMAAYDAFEEEKRQISQDQKDRMNKVERMIRHDSAADAFAMLAMIPSPPAHWRGLKFGASEPVDHPGLWNKTDWAWLGFRPTAEAKPFAVQEYRHRKGFTASCRLYDVSAVVPIKRRPRRAPVDDAE